MDPDAHNNTYIFPYIPLTIIILATIIRIDNNDSNNTKNNSVNGCNPKP